MIQRRLHGLKKLNYIYLYSENKAKFGTAKLEHNFNRATKVIERSFSKKAPLVKNNKVNWTLPNNSILCKTDNTRSPDTSATLRELPFASSSPLITRELQSAEKEKNDPCSMEHIEKVNISICLLESKWVTEDTIRVLFDPLNDTTELHINFLKPVITMDIKYLNDFEHVFSAGEWTAKFIVDKYLFIY